MTAPTVTEAEVIDHGWAVYRTAMESEWADEKATGNLVMDLRAALGARDAAKALDISGRILAALPAAGGAR